MKIETKFDINEKIQFVDIDLIGTIREILIRNSKGFKYQITFIRNNEFHSDWFFEDQIKKYKEKKKIGL